MAGSLLYVNARIKSLENGLLNQMQLSRLAEAENLQDAFKILQECGYGAGLQIEDIRSYENLIAEKERQASAFLRENLFKNSGLEIFLLKNDYHNAKVLMKAKYLRLENVGDMVAPDGLLSLEVMQSEIKDDKYEKFPKEMAVALQKIDQDFVDGNRSPRLIDTTIDEAMFRNISRILKSSGQKPLSDYFKAWVDTTNILSFIRTRKLGLDFDFFESVFISCGTIQLSTLKDLYDATNEKFIEKMKYTPYGELVVKAFEEDGLVKYETYADNFLMNIFKQSKYDMFSVAPIAGFYLGQLTEIKVIKLIIAGIKNKVDTKILKIRLRELYA